jgi:hypothetical protein
MVRKLRKNILVQPFHKISIKAVELHGSHIIRAGDYHLNCLEDFSSVCFPSRTRLRRKLSQM